MNVPTPTIDSLPAPDRKKLNKLLAERAMYGISFSFAKLIKPMGTVDAIKECVSAYDEDEAKAEKQLLNENITDVLSANNTTSVRGADQFGVTRDLIYIESSSTSLSATRLKELAPKFGIKLDVAEKWIEAATTRKSYTTVQCRRVKDKSNG